MRNAPTNQAFPQPTADEVAVEAGDEEQLRRLLLPLMQLLSALEAMVATEEATDHEAEALTDRTYGSVC